MTVIEFLCLPTSKYDETKQAILQRRFGKRTCSPVSGVADQINQLIYESGDELSYSITSQGIRFSDGGAK